MAMTESRNDDLIFVYLGTVDYHFMIQKNIKLLRLLYPDSRVIVYDWGDANGQPGTTEFPEGTEVIDWTERLKDTWYLGDIYDDEHRIDIAKKFNSREDGTYSRRLNKFFLKRFPGSPPAQRMIVKALRYDNLLLHKSYNLQDCSTRLAGKRFFLVDADAYLVDRIDEIFDGDPDVILPMMSPENHRWDYNNCQGLNTGVMGFNGRTAARDAFLRDWYAAIEGNDEWLRELVALNRLIHSKSPEFFDDWGLHTLKFEEREVKIRTIENEIYNCYFNYQDTPSDFDRVKILHLAGIMQRKHLFPKYIGTVEEVLQKRLQKF